MTIALVIPSLPKYSETFLTNKINGLVNNGFSVVLMVVGVSERRKMNVPVYYQPILAPQGLLRWSFTFWLILKSVLLHPQRCLRLLNEASNAGHNGFGKWRMIAVLSNFLKINADCIHFAYGTMAVERAFIGRVLGAKVSMSIRGYDIAIAPVMNSALYTHVWPYLDKLHSISNDLVKVAEKQGMPLKLACEVITPAIDLTNFTNFKKRLWNQNPKFLTVSRLHWKKGLEYTMQALALLDFDFTYTIIGEGPELERLLFAAYQLGISDKVNFVGKKNQEYVSEAMCTHDIYLQYSIQEGFCNAVLEAQASGMLCIVSNAEGLSENVLHAETGWIIEKRRPDLLATCINQVFALTSDQKLNISTLAARRIKSDFALEKQQERFKRFFANA